MFDNRDDRKIAVIKQEFWKQVLQEMPTGTELFTAATPPKRDAMVGKRSYVGIHFTVIAQVKGCRVELYISRKQKENKIIFDILHSRKTDIEQSFGAALKWERLDHRIASRISYHRKGVSIREESDWGEMIDFLNENIIKLEKTICGALEEAMRKTS